MSRHTMGTIVAAVGMVLVIVLVIGFMVFLVMDSKSNAKAAKADKTRADFATHVVVRHVCLKIPNGDKWFLYAVASSPYGVSLTPVKENGIMFKCNNTQGEKE